MSDGTKIEWTDATANVVNGCSVLSPGCTNCYAMRIAGTRMKHHPTRAGLTRETKAGPVWNGTTRFHEPALQQVLRWQRPRMIFWNAHGDLFHESVPDEWIDRCFAVMAMTPQHKHQVLTKRPARMREYFSHPERGERINHAGYVADIEIKIEGGWRKFSKFGGINLPLENVWLGVSVEDQTRADERIPDLLATPAAVRWISAEPLLGPVDFNELPAETGGSARKLFGPLSGYCDRHFPKNDCGCGRQQSKLDWVVAGGESGPNARPMHPDWARSLRDQCAAAGVPFLFKQWGESCPLRNDLIPVRANDVGWINLNGRVEWDVSEERCIAMAVEDEANPSPGYHLICKVGKKRAGRLLDGVEHNGYPA